MTELTVSGPAQPGELLDGRYRLEHLIGEGGMGSVWRASDEALGRTVAVKVFWAGATEDSDAVRRESEKRLLASLSHPSLVTLFDAQLSHEGRSYLVMEYIDGGTLGSLISAGPISPPDAASVAADLGEALHVVHAAGIIHRDVKPANILLRPPLTPNHTFRAVLADFGIAYLIDSARVTTPGTAIGTAAYISPEQVRGHAPSTASDIYSLGLVLLEALSGRRAFPQQTPMESISVRLTTPPDVPGDWGYGWRSLLTSMTAIDPQRPSLGARGVGPRSRAGCRRGRPRSDRLRSARPDRSVRSGRERNHGCHEIAPGSAPGTAPPGGAARDGADCAPGRSGAEAADGCRSSRPRPASPSPLGHRDRRSRRRARRPGGFRSDLERPGIRTPARARAPRARRAAGDAPA